MGAWLGWRLAGCVVLMIAIICTAAVLFRNRTNRIRKPKGVMAFGILLIAGSVFTICVYAADLIFAFDAIRNHVSVFAIAISMLLPLLALVSGIFLLQLEGWARRVLLVLVVFGLVCSILGLMLTAQSLTDGGLFRLLRRTLLEQILCFPYYTVLVGGEGEGVAWLIILTVYVYIITPMKLAFYVSALVYFNKKRIKSLFNWRSKAAGRAVGPTAHNRPSPAPG